MPVPRVSTPAPSFARAIAWCSWLFVLLGSTGRALNPPQKPDPAALRAERVDWVGRTAFPLRDVTQLGAEDDFTDLEPLVDLLDGARVVLLGEPTHGDGTVLLAKARLLRFLHQRMGFDVLAFESGLFDCRAVDRELRREGRSTAAAAAFGLYWVWALAAEFQPTLAYVRESLAGPRPIEITGFDCQFSSGRARVDYPDALLCFLRTPGADVLGESLQARFLGAYGPVLRREEMSSAQIDEMLAVIDRLHEAIVVGNTQLSKVHSPRDIAFYERTLDNLYTFTESRRMDVDRMERENLRDAAMAENLIWLADEVYPERKIVGWGAQAHFLYASESLKPPRKLEYSMDGMRSMGIRVHEALGDEVFSLCFVAGEGEYGLAFREAEPLGPLPEDSIESWFRQLNAGPMLLDLRPRARNTLPWLALPWLAAPVYHQFCSADWTEQVDALYYLPKLAPCSPITDAEDREVQEVLAPAK